MTAERAPGSVLSIAGFIGRDSSTGRCVTRIGSGESPIAGSVDPLAGVEVWLRSGSEGEDPRRTWTDERGEFAFQGLSSGDYRVVLWLGDRGIIGPKVTIVSDA